jgi:hypothetical protein
VVLRTRIGRLQAPIVFSLISTRSICVRMAFGVKAGEEAVLSMIFFELSKSISKA